GEGQRLFGRGEFVGRVIAGSERVFALVRRSQNSGLTDTFVVAIDVGDGSLLWQRHIASTASGVRHEPAPPPRMSQANGRLYVSDNLAVVSALDQRRGTVLWTRVFERELDDLRRRPRVASPPAVDMPPILVDAGLLVPGLGDTGQGSVTLLDAATGQSRVIEPSDAFRDAERVLPAGDDVLVIGSTVRRLAGATLDPRWSVELPRTRRDVAGEPAVSARRLALPVEDAILFLDMDSGQVTGRIRLDEPANVTLLDGQAVAATAQTLRSYLSWDRAYADLRRQIDDARHDTRPGLALAELARRASRGEAVLEGADHALAALVRPPAADRDPARQRQLFDHLLELARDGTGLDTPTRQGLFDRIATVTAGPGQEVAYHLAVSRFLEHAGQAARAVDHLQAVLGEPTLAQQLYEQPLVARQAGLEARRRLARLVARLGPTIYDKYDRLARQRFDELTTPTTPATPAGDPGAQALIRLADRFPEAMVAPRARLAAAGALATEQQPAEAARQLRLAYDQARHRGDRAAAAGRLAELHEHQGRLELAAAWLRQVRQAEPELEPERDGQPVTIDAWLTELSGQRATAATGLPRLGLPLDEVQSMAGRPVPGHEGAALPADQFLLAGDGWLRLHAGPDREQAWEAELDMAEPRLLAAGAGQLLLWSPADRRLAAFDAETGESPWPTIDVRRAMGGADSLEDRKAARREQQRRFLELVEANNVLVRESQRPGQAGPHVHAGAAAIVLADADGQVVGVDRATGQVLWSRLADLDQVVAVAAGGQAFAIAGVTGTDDAAAAVVLLLDESTGEPLAGPLEAAEPAQWIGFAGPGLIVTAAEQQITAYRAQSGQVAWRLDVAGPALTDEAWADDNLLIIRDLDGRALVIEVETGDVVQRLTATQGRRPGDFQVTAAQGLWHIRTHEQVLALDARGKQVWRDAIDLPEAERFVHQLVTRDHVLVISEQGSDEQQVLLDRGVIRQEDIERLDRLDRQILEGQVGFDGSGHHRIYVLHRRGGGLLAEHELDPLPEPLSVERSLAVDGAVVLSYGDRTAVVAADPAPEADDEPVDEPADEPTEAADEPPADPAPPLSAAEGGGAPLPLAQEGSIQHK
ncbi:MAG: PQQ-binding-like beta-propeller repeat protein, partial [Phycisphaeraceae bacterium]